jgi:DNA-directed RNA polymerase II subunit RPB1
MGMLRPGQPCQTCLESKRCQGHIGHIKLAEPIFNLGYLEYVVRVLRCICHSCGLLKFVQNDDQQARMEEVLQIRNPLRRLKELADLLGGTKFCRAMEGPDQLLVGCGNFIPHKFSLKDKTDLFTEDYDNQKLKPKEYTAKRVNFIFGRIRPLHLEILGFRQSKPADFLISSLVVAPPQVRTSVELGPTKMAEDDLTHAYSRIVALNKKLKDGLDPLRHASFLKDIQKLAACIMNKLDRRYLPKLKHNEAGKKVLRKALKSIEERLVAKEGRFRQNLMGKRVDFSARTVISPDSNLDLDEVGVPESIAQKLTVPETIHEFNYERIVDLCRRGKVKFLLQQTKDGEEPNIYYLNSIRPEDLEENLQYGTVVERELENGDYVLFNRQPTLHRMSMMGHRVRILPHQTFRLNLSVCSPYNADFDGDEMNLHVPQSVEAMAELKHLAAVPKQFISPKNSCPVMGLVQDSQLGIFLLTHRDVFLTKPQLLDLIAWVKPGKEEYFDDLPTPCILKPQELWSGKQAIDYVLPSRVSIDSSYDENSKMNNSDRDCLVILKGNLVSGMLQKEHVGPGVGVIIHAVWVEIGPTATCDLVNALQKIATNWLMLESFSVGVIDAVA